tara:strand:+ start:268 stop:939 length:672 start_codon:yes stop_codon:yes gene_type:complete
MKKGRPTKFKEPIKNKIIDAIGVGSTYTMACNYAGISRNTLHQWMTRGENQTRGVYRTFYDDIKKAEAKGAVANLAVINNEAKRGNWKCSAWLLERRWGYKRDSQFNNMDKEAETKEPTAVPTTPIQLFKQQSIDLQDAMKQAKEAQSWQAYASLQRQFVQVLEHIRQIEAEEGSTDSLDSASDEVLKTETVHAIISLPPILRQSIIEELARFNNVIPMQNKK